jgi:hypothetical protein
MWWWCCGSQLQLPMHLCVDVAVAFLLMVASPKQVTLDDRLHVQLLHAGAQGEPHGEGFPVCAMLDGRQS